MTMLANLVIGILIVMYAIGFMVCAVYCRIQKRSARKTLRCAVATTQSPETSAGQPSEADVSKCRAKAILRIIRKRMEPYLYGLSRYLVIVVGKIPSCRIRKLLMRYVFCMDISKEAVLYGGFEIRSPWNVKIGRAVIGVGALIDGRMSVTIEDDVVLASSVSIYTVQHDVNDPMFRVNNKGGAVVIHNHAWISSHSTVLPKVEIGEGAVLSAGAIATKSLEPFGIYSGIPATKKRERNQNLEYVSGKTYWHFY